MMWSGICRCFQSAPSNENLLVYLGTNQVVTRAPENQNPTFSPSRAGAGPSAVLSGDDDGHAIRFRRGDSYGATVQAALNVSAPPLSSRTERRCRESPFPRSDTVTETARTVYRGRRGSHWHVRCDLI